MNLYRATGYPDCKISQPPLVSLSHSRRVIFDNVRFLPHFIQIIIRLLFYRVIKKDGPKFIPLYFKIETGDKYDVNYV
jgi:hypothetical protein